MSRARSARRPRWRRCARARRTTSSRTTSGASCRRSTARSGSVASGASVPGRRPSGRPMERRFREVLAMAPDAIVATDEDYRITIFNRAAEEMFGVVEAKALGRSIKALVPGLFTDAPGPDLRDLYRLSGVAGPLAIRREITGRRRDRRGVLRRGVDLAAGRGRTPDLHGGHPRRQRAPGARGAAPPRAEDGGGRPAHRRHRARLQQPAHGDPRQSRAAARRSRGRIRRRRSWCATPTRRGTAARS